jgi:hypothetical protein
MERRERREREADPRTVQDLPKPEGGRYEQQAGDDRNQTSRMVPTTNEPRASSMG